MRWEDELPRDLWEDEKWLELVCRNCGEVMYTMRYVTDEAVRWRVCRRCYAQWEQWPDGSVKPARALSLVGAILTVFCSWGDWRLEPASIRRLFGEDLPVPAAGV